MRCINILLRISTDDARKRCFPLRVHTTRIREKRIYGSGRILANHLLHTRAYIWQMHDTRARYTYTNTLRVKSIGTDAEQTRFRLSFTIPVSCTYILKYKSYRSLDVLYLRKCLSSSQSNHMFEHLSLIIVKLERKIVRQKGAHRKERYKHHWIGQDDRLHTLNFINFDDRLHTLNLTNFGET